MSRDGKFIAFESLAVDPKANAAASTGNTGPYVSFVYNATTDTFAQVGPRGDSTQPDPVLHVPVFTDYNSALSPASVMFSSALDFTPNGTLVTDTTGMNPNFVAQIFLAPLPVLSTGPFTRISNFPVVGGGVGASPSNSRRRFAFSRPAELGGGNSDGSTEDVTSSAIYDVNDKDVGIINDSGLLKVSRQPGEVAVMVRYQGQVGVFRATVPLGAPAWTAS